MLLNMHRNEMPYDIPILLKRKIANHIGDLAFNYYPEPYGESLLPILAQRYGCQTTELLVGPGSSAFIRLILTYYAFRGRGEIAIARPSFGYYEDYCRAFSIPYLVWDLNEEFEYSASTLPKLKPGSVVLLASPNNPTGRLIDPSLVDQLLSQHPETTWVVDEAYAEFAGSSFVGLVTRHPNLVILRTLSKALSVAGLRCGAMIATPAYIDLMRSLQTPYQMSAVSLEIIKFLLRDDERNKWSDWQISQVIAERDRWLARCRKVANNQFMIYPTITHFALFQAIVPQARIALLAACRDRGILIADLHNRPRLAHCVRVSSGQPEQNDAFTSALQNAIAATQEVCRARV